jgi:transposase
MQVREVIARAMSGELTWIQAAEICGFTPRTMRRWKQRYERSGYDGLWDRRRRTPSPRRTPFAEVQRILRLYRERYPHFNVRHFHELARHEHGVTLSYTFVKAALQAAGLVRKQKVRGRHRRRREPRPCFGELLHLDGSPHEWLAWCPGERQTLIAIIDDATSQVLYAQLVAREATATVMAALWAVLETHGIPQGLYTDRASWAAVTRQAGEAADRTRRTQLGRALDRLGIEHILAYSPQARGRGERLNRTLQDRLVNELRARGLRTVAAAHAYLRDEYLPRHNAQFSRSPADPASAFVPLGRVDLAQILCHQEERTVARDNTIVIANVVLQIEKQPGRRSCAGLQVLVRRHLDRTYTIWLGERRLGRYDAAGQPQRPKSVAA